MAEAAPDLQAPSTTAWTPTMVGVTATILVIGWTLGWLGRSAGLTTAGDDATYLSMSWSLHAGHYGELFFFGSPPHAQYPPGFPAWLLLVRLLLGASFEAIVAANLFLLGVTAVLLSDTLRRLGRPWVGVCAAAVVMWNPGLLKLSAEVMSESLFVALCMLALWSSLRSTQGAGHRYTALAVGAALCTFLTRTAGISLLPAIAVGLLWNRQWRALATSCIAFGLAVVGWFAYTGWASKRTDGFTYAADFAVGQTTDWLGTATRLAGSAKLYFLLLADQFGLPGIPGTGIDNLLFGLILLVPALVGTAILIRRWPALPAFLLASVAMLIYYPWSVTRFMTALLPPIVLIVLLGTIELARMARRRSPSFVAAGLAAGLALFGIARTGSATQRSVACRALPPYHDARCYDPEARSFFAAIRFIQDSLPPDAVVATTKPSTIYVRTGHSTIPLTKLADAPLEEVMAPAGRATHILLGRLISPSYLLVAPSLQRQCTALTVIAHFPPATLLLRMRRDGEARDACADLESYRRLPRPTFDLAPD